MILQHLFLPCQDHYLISINMATQATWFIAIDQSLKQLLVLGCVEVPFPCFYLSYLHPFHVPVLNALLLTISI